MDPLSLLGGIASLGSSIIGGLTGNSQRQQATNALNQALQDIQAAGAPPDLAGQMLLQRFQQVGLYTPELQQAVQLGVSKLSQVQANPQLQQAQTNALQQLGQRAAGGLTASDIAAYNQMRNQTAASTQGAMQSALQNARAQGFNTQQGNMLQQQLLAAQQGAQTQSAQGDQLAGQASQNALAALGQYQGAASNLNQQEFNQAATRAQAADQFSVFNTQAQIARQQQNVAAQNQAQQQNLAQQQQTANQNVDVANQQKAAQLALQQQQWQSALAYGQAQAQPLYAQAQYSASNANVTGQQFQNIGQGLGGLLNTIAAGQKTTPVSTDQANVSDTPEQLNANQQSIAAGFDPKTGLPLN